MSIYETLRSDILNGAFQPGSKLKLEQLKERYRAGTNALRESLTRLSSEGLVDAQEQRGFRVAETSLDRLRDLTRLRVLLEVDGARRSLETGGLEWESALVAAHHKLAHIERQMQADPNAFIEIWSQYDWEFHTALLAACGSRLHCRYHRQIFDQFRQFVVIELETHGFRGEEIIAEHEAILNAALSRDADRCAEALQAHISVFLRRSEAAAG